MQRLLCAVVATTRRLSSQSKAPGWVDEQTDKGLSGVFCCSEELALPAGGPLPVGALVTDWLCDFESSEEFQDEVQSIRSTVALQGTVPMWLNRLHMCLASQALTSW